MEPTDLKLLFAQRVTALAKQKGWSITRLADFAGISRGYLSAVLRGKKSASLRTIAMLASALECEPWELLKPQDARG